MAVRKDKGVHQGTRIGEKCFSCRIACVVRYIINHGNIDVESALLPFLSKKISLRETADFEGQFGSSQSLWQGILRGQELVALGTNPIWRILKGALFKK